MSRLLLNSIFVCISMGSCAPAEMRNLNEDQIIVELNDVSTLYDGQFLLRDRSIYIPEAKIGAIYHEIAYSRFFRLDSTDEASQIWLEFIPQHAGVPSSNE